MIDDTGCSVDELLDCNKVCFLVRENRKTYLKFIESEKYTNYIRFISVTALVLHFIENLKSKINKDTLNLKRFVTTVGKSKAGYL